MLKIDNPIVPRSLNLEPTIIIVPEPCGTVTRLREKADKS